MNLQEATYYAEIGILVDGWPWNLSEFDFRRWFAPGATPRALGATEIADEMPLLRPAQGVSENRRAGKRRRQRDRRRKAA